MSKYQKGSSRSNSFDRDNAQDPGNELWSFLEEIDAPQWVDLSKEVEMAEIEGDDPWFYISHPHHEQPLYSVIKKANAHVNTKSTKATLLRSSSLKSNSTSAVPSKSKNSSSDAVKSKLPGLKTSKSSSLEKSKLDVTSKPGQKIVLKLNSDQEKKIPKTKISSSKSNQSSRNDKINVTLDIQPLNTDEVSLTNRSSASSHIDSKLEKEYLKKIDDSKDVIMERYGMVDLDFEQDSFHGSNQFLDYDSEFYEECNYDYSTSNRLHQLSNSFSIVSTEPELIEQHQANGDKYEEENRGKSKSLMGENQKCGKEVEKETRNEGTKEYFSNSLTYSLSLSSLNSDDRSNTFCDVSDINSSYSGNEIEYQLIDDDNSTSQNSLDSCPSPVKKLDSHIPADKSCQPEPNPDTKLKDSASVLKTSENGKAKSKQSNVTTTNVPQTSTKASKVVEATSGKGGSNIRVKNDSIFDRFCKKNSKTENGRLKPVSFLESASSLEIRLAALKQLQILENEKQQSSVSSLTDIENSTKTHTSFSSELPKSDSEVLSDANMLYSSKSETDLLRFIHNEKDTNETMKKNDEKTKLEGNEKDRIKGEKDAFLSRFDYDYDSEENNDEILSSDNTEVEYVKIGRLDPSETLKSETNPKSRLSSVKSSFSSSITSSSTPLKLALNSSSLTSTRKPELSLLKLNGKKALSPIDEKPKVKTISTTTKSNPIDVKSKINSSMNSGKATNFTQKSLVDKLMDTSKSASFDILSNDRKAIAKPCISGNDENPCNDGSTCSVDSIRKKGSTLNPDKMTHNIQLNEQPITAKKFSALSLLNLASKTGSRNVNPSPSTSSASRKSSSTVDSPKTPNFLNNSNTLNQIQLLESEKINDIKLKSSIMKKESDKTNDIYAAAKVRIARRTKSVENMHIFTSRIAKSTTSMDDTSLTKIQEKLVENNASVVEPRVKASVVSSNNSDLTKSALAPMHQRTKSYNSSLSKRLSLEQNPGVSMKHRDLKKEDQLGYKTSSKSNNLIVKKSERRDNKKASAEIDTPLYLASSFDSDTATIETVTIDNHHKSGNYHDEDYLNILLDGKQKSTMRYESTRYESRYDVLDKNTKDSKNSDYIGENENGTMRTRDANDLMENEVNGDISADEMMGKFMESNGGKETDSRDLSRMSRIHISDIDVHGIPHSHEIYRPQQNGKEDCISFIQSSFFNNNIDKLQMMFSSPTLSSSFSSPLSTNSSSMSAHGLGCSTSGSSMSTTFSSTVPSFLPTSSIALNELSDEQKKHALIEILSKKSIDNGPPSPSKLNKVGRNVSEKLKVVRSSFSQPLNVSRNGMNDFSTVASEKDKNKTQVRAMTQTSLSGSRSSLTFSDSIKSTDKKAGLCFGRVKINEKNQKVQPTSKYEPRIIAAKDEKSWETVNGKKSYDLLHPKEREKACQEIKLNKRK